MNRALRSYVLSGALALHGSVARSQTPSAQEQAEVCFQRGRSLEEGGRAAEAIAEYRRALALEETPAGYVRLGGALRTLGRYRDAISSLEHALGLTREDPEGYSALAHAATAAITELRASLSYWSVNATPPEASVSFDGALTPGAERWHEADPGSHVLVVQRPGYATVSRAISLASGVREALTVVLPVHALPDGSGTQSNPPGFLSPGRAITHSPWFWLSSGVITAGMILGAVLLFSSTEPEFSGTFYGTVPSGIMVGP